MRIQIILRCEEESCGRSAYHSTKNKRNTVDRVLIKKYCKWCRKHTQHKEAK